MLQPKSDKNKKEENTRNTTEDVCQVLGTERQDGTRELGEIVGTINLDSNILNGLEIGQDSVIKNGMLVSEKGQNHLNSSTNSIQKNRNHDTQNRLSCCINSVGGVHCCVKHVTDELVSDLTEELHELDNMLERNSCEKYLSKQLNTQMMMKRRNLVESDHDYFRQISDFEPRKLEDGSSEEVGVIENSKLMHVCQSPGDNEKPNFGATPEFHLLRFTSSDEDHSFSEDVATVSCDIDVRNVVDQICQQVCDIAQENNKSPNTACKKSFENVQYSDQDDVVGMAEDFDIIISVVDKLCKKVSQSVSCVQNSALVVEDDKGRSRTSTSKQKCAFGTNIPSTKFHVMTSRKYLNSPKSLEKENRDQLTSTKVNTCNFEDNGSHNATVFEEDLDENINLPEVQVCNKDAVVNTELNEKYCSGKSSSSVENSVLLSGVGGILRECDESAILSTQDCNTYVRSQKYSPEFRKENSGVIPNTRIQNCETGVKDSVDECRKNHDGNNNIMKVRSNEHKTLFVEKKLDLSGSHLSKELLMHSNPEKFDLQPVSKSITIPQLSLKRSVSFSHDKAEVEAAKKRSKRLRMSLENFPLLLKNVTKVNIASRDIITRRNPVEIKQKTNTKSPLKDDLNNKQQEGISEMLSTKVSNNCMEQEDSKLLSVEHVEKVTPNKVETPQSFKISSLVQGNSEDTETAPEPITGKEYLDEDCSRKGLQQNESKRAVLDYNTLVNDSREEESALRQNDCVKTSEISSKEKFVSNQNNFTKTIEKNVSKPLLKSSSSQRCKVVVPRIDPKRLDNLKKNRSTTSSSKGLSDDAFDEMDTTSLTDADYLDTMPISKLKTLLGAIKNKYVLNEATEKLNNKECESQDYGDSLVGDADTTPSIAAPDCLMGANLATGNAKMPDKIAKTKSGKSPENLSKSKRKSKPVKLNFNDSKKQKTFLTHKRLRKIPDKLLDKFICARKDNHTTGLAVNRKPGDNTPKNADFYDVRMRNADSYDVTMQNADSSDINLLDEPDNETQDSVSICEKQPLKKNTSSTSSNQVSCLKSKSTPEVTSEAEKKDSSLLSKTGIKSIKASKKDLFSRNGCILKPHSSEVHNCINDTSTPKGSLVRRDLRVSISPIGNISKRKKILVTQKSGSQKKNNILARQKDEFSSLKNNSKSLVIETPREERNKRCDGKNLNVKPSSGKSEQFQNTKRSSDSGDEKLCVLAPFHYLPKLGNIKMTFEPGVVTCCFCHLPANHLPGLGDLFGPYRPLAEEVLARHETVNEHLKLNPTIAMQDPAHAASGSPQVTINTEKSTCFLTARVEEDQTNVDGSTVKDITKAVERSSHRLRTLSTIEHVLQNTNNIAWQRKQKLIPNIKKNSTLRIPGPKDECELTPGREFNSNDSQKSQNESVVPNINSIVFLEPNINMPHVGSNMGSPQLSSGHSSPQDVTPDSSSRGIPQTRIKTSPRSRNLQETTQDASSDTTCVCISHGFSTTPLWVHGNCAVWADGVYAIRGQLYGLWDAARMSNQITCNFCNRPGATIASKQDSINSKINNVPLKAYHYPCSIAAKLNLNWENLTAQR